MEEKCRWLMPEQGSKDKVNRPVPICGKPARSVVIMGTAAGRARVPVCEEHRAEHNRRAAAMRATSK